MEAMRIKELGIEITKPKEWSKRYDEIKTPKGWRMIKVWELWFILDGSKYMDKFLGKLKGRWCLFWCEQTAYAKKNKILSWLVLGRGLDLISYWDGLDDSISDGRVVFAREMEK